MNKNLDVTHFRNGDTIIESQNIEEWYQALRDKKPAWCYYEFKDENGKRDGKIYNVYALIDERGLAPSGFHISSKNEWLILYQFIRDEPSTKDYQIGYAKLRLTQIKVTEIIEEKKAGYDEETWVKCSNCSYWTQKQKENNPCSKCKNNGGKYVKTGKHIPSKIVKKEVVTNVGWDGSNDYNFNLSPGGFLKASSYPDEEFALKNTEFLGIGRMTAHWALDEEEKLTDPWGDINLRRWHIVQTQGFASYYNTLQYDSANGFYVRCIQD